MKKQALKIPLYETRLVRTRYISTASNISNVKFSTLAAKVLYKICGDSPVEKFCVLYTNGALDIIGCEIVAHGGLNTMSIQPKELVRGAIISGCAAMIIGHNHPSGDTTPSQDDIIMTREAKNASNFLGIPLLDHVIVGHGHANFTSVMDYL